MAITQFTSENQSIVANVPVYIPDYAVLFYYDVDLSLFNTNNGTNNGVINQDYYRQVKEFCYPNLPTNVLAFGDTDGPSYGAWNQTLGMYHKPIITLLDDTYGTLLDISGAHNPTTIGFRTSIPYSWGALSGDPLTTGKGNTYTSQTSPVPGHYHSLNGLDINKQIIKYTTTSSASLFGVTDYSGNTNTLGLPLTKVNPLLRDPNLNKGNDKIGWLPQDILVFGNNLPTDHYTQSDNKHFAPGSTNPITGLPRTTYGASGNTITGSNNSILAFQLNSTGYFDNQNNDWTSYNSNAGFNVSLFSNTSGAHTHTGIIPKVNQLSTKTSQVANVLINSGLHSHLVTYNTTLGLNITKLKGWITTSSQTPIANGVIIGYALSNNLGYSGPDLDVSGNLPPNWHFCDGTNGTPDLRSQFILVNMNPSDPDHGVQLANGMGMMGPDIGTLTFNNITVQANGYHSHVSPAGKKISSPTIYGTTTDIGSHDFESGTNHTHPISTVFSFPDPLTGQYLNNITSTQNNQFDLVPPNVNLGFIMYNNTIA